MSKPDPSTLRFIRRKQVKAKTGLSDWGIDNATAKGTFPKAVFLGDHEGVRAQAWLAHEIDSWMERMIERARDPLNPLPKARGGPGRGHRKQPEPTTVGRPKGSRNKRPAG